MPQFEVILIKREIVTIEAENIYDCDNKAREIATEKDMRVLDYSRVESNYDIQDED